MTSLTLIGKKRGMTQMFGPQGKAIACTVIQANPNFVIQIKTANRDGYDAIQIGAIKRKKVNKPMKGHFLKAGEPVFCRLAESKVPSIDAYQIGQKIEWNYFKQGDFVDVRSISKGKGYQGLIKLHGFRGGPAAHGSGFHRHAGSTGMRTYPGRCFPGGKRASHMGQDRITIQNLEIMYIDPEKEILVLKGAVAGYNGCPVYISKAKKKGK